MMTSQPAGMVDPKAAVATVGGQTYVLHPRRSFGARLVTFIARSFVLIIVGGVAFGAGYLLQERESRDAIAEFERRAIEAETALRVRDESSLTIELNVADIVGDLRGELAQAAETRLRDASEQLRSAVAETGAASEPTTGFGAAPQTPQDSVPPGTSSPGSVPPVPPSSPPARPFGPGN